MAVELIPSDPRRASFAINIEENREMAVELIPVKSRPVSFAINVERVAPFSRDASSLVDGCGGSVRSESTISPTTPSDSIKLHIHLPYDRILPITVPAMSTISTLKSLIYPDLAVLPDDLSRFMLHMDGRNLGDAEIVGEIEGVRERGMKLVLAGEAERKEEGIPGWEFLERSRNQAKVHTEFTCSVCRSSRIQCISCSRLFCPTCTRLSPSDGFTTPLSSRLRLSLPPPYQRQVAPPRPQRLLGKSVEEGEKPTVQCSGCLALKVERSRGGSRGVAVWLAFVIVLLCGFRYGWGVGFVWGCGC
ncbi:hypothetical protein BC829DRAFT_68483 [Chytridium lagenaria]|nr:hypothetical protein BC829DRAFT_68483 [Chytridium lagenaria]